MRRLLHTDPPPTQLIPTIQVILSRKYPVSPQLDCSSTIITAGIKIAVTAVYRTGWSFYTRCHGEDLFLFEERFSLF
jgi:hypothetical protein